MIEPFVALKASAGSGKTFALSVRYIALLLNGASVNSIMALTFTKKAASEMSSRIIATFLNLEKKEAELAEICKLLELGQDEVLKRRDRLKDEFLSSNLKIMTFDSFFALVLRLFSLNLGIDPNYNSKSKINTTLIYEFIKEVSKDSVLLQTLAFYIFEFSRSQNSFFEALENFYENFRILKISNIAKPHSNDVMFIVKWFCEMINSNEKSSKNAKNAFNVKNVDELLEKGFWERESLDYSTFKGVYTSEFDIKFNELKEALRLYLNELEAYKINEIAKFLDIYKMVRKQLATRLNEISFSDVTKMVHELLVGNIDRQMLYFRLDANITHLLIDEFQDTNIDQYEIIKPLIEEIVSGYGQNGLGSFFYVGDIKQSIYRFRGGKKELFDRLTGDFSQIKSVNLTHNYRSSRNLVLYVNQVFSKSHGIGLFSDEEAQIPAIEDDGYIEVVASDDIVDTCVKKVLWLIDNGVNLDDISVLCWKNDNVREICEALRIAGVDAKDEGGMLLKNSPNVFCLINYAKFCLFGDEIYRQNLQAYLNIDVKELKLDMLKTAAQSLYYLAKYIKMDTGDINLLRLFEIAQGYGSLIKFIFDFENSDEPIAQNSGHGIRVMTTHKSKGLEFKHVLLCDRIGRAKSDTGSFIYEYDMQRGWQIKLKAKNREYFDEDYKNLKDKSKELDKEEDINKLYVAMTRAKNSLIIIKRQNPNGNNPSYFSAYDSNKKRVEYLNLECFTQGKIEVESYKSAILGSKSDKNIEILSVERDDTVGKKDMYTQNLHAIYFGMGLHYLLEMSEKFDEDSIKKSAILLKNKFSKFLSSSDIDDIILRAVAFVNDDRFKYILMDSKIFKEQPLNFEGALKQLDLLCIRGDEMIVVDYKSSNFSVDENKKQVREYVEILSKLYPQKHVYGVIFYILRNGIECIKIS